jgi:hypothetical protein
MKAVGRLHGRKMVQTSVGNIWVGDIWIAQLCSGN